MLNFAVGQTVCDNAAYSAGGGSNQCINGKRICGAVSSSTVGWGGEPDRALDQTTHGSCKYIAARTSNLHRSLVQFGAGMHLMGLFLFVYTCRRLTYLSLSL